MDVFDLVAKLSLDQSEYESGLTDAQSKASGFGSGLKTAMGVGAAAIGAVTTAVVGVTGAFSSGLKEVANYGDEIDKTSQKIGMSAESYQQWDYLMNLAGTSMSECSMGMKTLTNQIDSAKSGSADAQANFEKLGISLEDLNTMSREDIWSATISGMQRLEDSTERASLANDLFGRSGQNMTPLFNMTNEELEEAVSNFDKYNMALSDEGVEASANFKDSLTTMQTAFGSLKNNMLADFLPSVTTVMDGLTEVFAGDSSKGIGLITEGITSFIDNLSDLIPEISEVGGSIMTSLIDAFTSNLDSILSAGADVMGQLADALLSNLPTIFDTAGQILLQITEGIIANLPSLISTGLEIIVNLANGIEEALPTLMPSIVEVVLQITQTLIEHLPELIEAGLNIMQGVIEGIITAIPLIVDALPDLIDAIITTLTESADLIMDGALEMFLAIVDAIPDIVTALVDALPQIIDSIVSFLTGDGLPQILQGAITMLMAIVNAIPTIVSSLASALPTIITTVITGLVGALPQIIQAAVTMLMGIIEAIPEIVSSLASNIPTIITGIVTALEAGLSAIKTVGQNLLTGLWNGISDKAEWLYSKITGLGSTVVDKVKSIFGVASPSKVFAEIGGYLAEGLELGWEDEIDDVNNKIGKDLQYQGEIDITTKTSDLTAPITKSANDSGRGFENTRLVLNNTTVIDGEVIEEKSYTYMIRRMGDELTATKIAEGGGY